MLNLRLSLLFALLVLFSIPFSSVRAEQPKRATWQTGFVGSPEPPLPLVLQRAYANLSFSGPISLNRLPETNRFLVLEQHNRIFSFEAREDVAQADLLVDFSKDKPLCGGLPDHEQRNISLFSIAFHPQFKKNHYAYICYTSSKEGEKFHVSRFTMDLQGPPQLVPGSELSILTCDGGGHQGCTLLFDKAGLLYISIGDLTEPSPPDRLETGQDISDLYASILRIDVDHPAGGLNYSIPKDNPFISLKWARPEVYAYGFRNPFRMSFDEVSGDLWVGDVGWEAWEMVYRVQPGGNYGWAIKEGPGDVKPQKPGPTPILPPEIALGHNEAASVTGGFVYYGQEFPELRGKYFFGDWITRKFWAASFDATRVTALQEIAVASVKPICFEVDASGELLVLDYSDANKQAGIYRFARNPAKDQPSQPFPFKLSQTKLFQDVAQHAPAAGVASYQINAPMWSDGAQAECLLALTGEDKVTFHQQPMKMFDWFTTTVSLPKGAVLAKTLSLALNHNQPEARRRIETQVALKDDQGDWQYYTYRWNDQGTDADLVPAAGSSQTLEIQDHLGTRKLNWQFASRSQCRTCHTPWSGETLGFIEPQLRKSTSQDDAWRELFVGGWAMAAKDVPLEDSHYRGFADPYDASYSIDQRARAYLHSNCSHCHMNGGNASTVFETQFNKPLHEGKLLSAKPMRGDFGIADAKIVAAGAPNQSILLYRFAKSGTGRMPHIGSQSTDTQGVQLIRQWIAGLPKDIDHVRRLEVLCGPTHKRNDEQRMEAAKELMNSVEGTTELASAIADQRVPKWLVASIVEQALRLEDPVRRDLLEPFATGELQVTRLGQNFSSAELLAIKGDASRGEKLFAAGVGQCAQCHRIGNVGKEVGPELSKIAQKLKTREKILASIVDPSAEIEDKFRPWTFVTEDGATLVGRILKRSDTEIELQDATGKNHQLAVESVEIEKLSTVSLMPPQLLATFTAQQAADLLAYLDSLR